MSRGVRDVPDLAIGVVGGVQQADDGAADIWHIGEVVGGVGRRQQHGRLALDQGPERGRTDVGDGYAGTVKVSTAQGRDPHPAGLGGVHPDAGDGGQDGRLGALLGERHVFAARRALRAQLIEVVEEHKPRVGDRAGLDDVGHGRDPDPTPDLAVIGETDGQNDLIGAVDGGADAVDVEGVAGAVVCAGGQVGGAAALGDADAVAAGEQGRGGGAADGAVADDDGEVGHWEAPSDEEA
jgi:hypothetical protein